MSAIDEDEALIAAALNGSAYAWEKLVKRYEGRIYNHGLRLTGNASDAMDLMQEVFLGVYRNLHRFRGDAKFSSWVFRIAHNKAVDMNRRKKLLSSHGKSKDDEDYDLFDSIAASSELEPELSAQQAETNRQIMTMLASLPIEQKMVVELKVFQAQTFEEIAASQDISSNTAKTRFYTALKKLKSLTEDQHVLS